MGVPAAKVPYLNVSVGFASGSGVLAKHHTAVERAPAASQAVAAEPAVAPVVITSSIKMMC
jgi:uncharacterized spore protein YtfJ